MREPEKLKRNTNNLTDLISSPHAINPQVLDNMAQQEYPSFEEDIAFDAEAIQRLAMQKIEAIQTEQQKEVASTNENSGVSSAGKAAGKSKRRRRITRFLTAAAACAVIISLGTGAFASLSTDERLLQVLHADSGSQIEQLGEMHTPLNLSKTVDGYTVTLKDAVSDRHNAWILIDVQAPQGVVLNEDLVLFDDTRIQMERESGYGFGIYPISDEDANDNKLSYILDFSARNKLAGQELSISFADLKANIINEEMSIIGEQMLASGPWEFSIEIPKRDSTVSMWQWKKLQCANLEFAVTKLEVSPLCLSMDMMKMNNVIYWKLQNEPVTVYLKEGTKLSLEVSGSGSGGALIQYQYEFPYPVELEQIERIEFCGETLNW